jgi:endonuclease YncB( thermonuclease family)
MPFTLIRGRYHVQGYEPDGDSVRFEANDEDHWKKLAGTVQLNARGHAQLRLEAIDTLETHYKGEHQPMGLAQKALDFLLHELGISAAVFDPLMLNTVEAEDATPGYIVSREVEKFGRPIAFAFAGTPTETDGSALFFTPARLRDSLNFKSVTEGLAYPTYYSGLFPDLRAELTAATQAARQAHREIWNEDVTNTGFDVPNLNAITEQHVILPKLFRRLVEFLRGGGTLDRFKAFLEAQAEEIVILSTGHFTHFDTIVEVQNGRVRLTELPENVMFVG